MASASPVTGTFVGTGISDQIPAQLRGHNPAKVNVTLTDGGSAAGTVQLQREFLDDPAVWHVLKEYTESDLPVAEIVEESEAGSNLRFECTARSAGTFVYRLSQ